MKKWLDKECDQSYALFEVQQAAQDMNFPPGTWRPRPRTRQYKSTRQLHAALRPCCKSAPKLQTRSVDCACCVRGLG
eukprot:1368286-Rhodomonas_salina.1